MASIIQIRRDSAADWTSANPTLADGEIGLETDTGKMKWGDGSTAWTSLSYYAGGFEVVGDTTPQLGGDLDCNSNSVTDLHSTERIQAVAALSIDVSLANVQTKSISANSTFTFTGWTTEANAVVLELTVTGTPTVTFTGATFKTTPTIATGLNVFIFTSVDNGTTINGFTARDGS